MRLELLTTHDLARQEKQKLELLMERLEVKKDPVKTTAAHVAERIGRLKPNAHLLSYSPLSRVVELESGIGCIVALPDAALQVSPQLCIAQWIVQPGRNV